MTTRRSIRLIRIARVARTLHIYLTMLAFLMMLFFAITGFVLNHEDWFTQGAGSHRDVHGTIAAASLAGPDRLAVVEALRSSFGAVGAVSTFDVDTNSIHVEMKGPGRQVDAEINRKTGATDVTIELKGIAVRLDDLHRGKDSGKVWSLIIDASALLLLIGSLTGIIMWFTLPRRRKLGLISLTAGIAICAVIYFVWVP